MDNPKQENVHFWRCPDGHILGEIEYEPMINQVKSGPVPILMVYDEACDGEPTEQPLTVIMPFRFRTDARCSICKKAAHWIRGDKISKAVGLEAERRARRRETRIIRLNRVAGRQGLHLIVKAGGESNSAKYAFANFFGDIVQVGEAVDLTLEQVRAYLTVGDREQQDKD